MSYHHRPSRPSTNNLEEGIGAEHSLHYLLERFKNDNKADDDGQEDSNTLSYERITMESPRERNKLKKNVLDYRRSQEGNELVDQEKFELDSIARIVESVASESVENSDSNTVLSAEESWDFAEDTVDSVLQDLTVAEEEQEHQQTLPSHRGFYKVMNGGRGGRRSTPRQADESSVRSSSNKSVTFTAGCKPSHRGQERKEPYSPSRNESLHTFMESSSSSTVDNSTNEEIENCSNTLNTFKTEMSHKSAPLPSSLNKGRKATDSSGESCVTMPPQGILKKKSQTTLPKRTNKYQQRGPTHLRQPPVSPANTFGSSRNGDRYRPSNSCNSSLVTPLSTNTECSNDSVETRASETMKYLNELDPVCSSSDDEQIPRPLKNEDNNSGTQDHPFVQARAKTINWYHVSVAAAAAVLHLTGDEEAARDAASIVISTEEDNVSEAAAQVFSSLIYGGKASRRSAAAAAVAVLKAGSAMPMAKEGNESSKQVSSGNNPSARKNEMQSGSASISPSLVVASSVPSPAIRTRRRTPKMEPEKRKKNSINPNNNIHLKKQNQLQKTKEKKDIASRQPTKQTIVVATNPKDNQKQPEVSNYNQNEKQIYDMIRTILDQQQDQQKQRDASDTRDNCSVQTNISKKKSLRKKMSQLLPFGRRS